MFVFLFSIYFQYFISFKLYTFVKLFVITIVKIIYNLIKLVDVGLLNMKFLILIYFFNNFHKL